MSDSDESDADRAKARALSDQARKDAAASAKRRENRVVINMGGVRFDTYKSTLRNIPDTRLSWLSSSTAGNADYDPYLGEYFFDRHPQCFNEILNYYRTGKLHAPNHVCGPLYEEELTFWGIDEKQIEPCCWNTYRTHRDAEEQLQEFGGLFAQEEESESDEDIAARFGIEEGADEASDGASHGLRGLWQLWQPKVWRVVDDPYSSLGAKLFNAISFIFISISIVVFCTQTLPQFRVDPFADQADCKLMDGGRNETNWTLADE